MEVGGVPIQIATKYEKPKRIILPDCPRVTASEVINGPLFRYDFILERQVLTKMAGMKLTRKARKLNIESTASHTDSNQGSDATL